jgi:hypothetical protein
MNAPLTSHHYYVADLPEGLVLVNSAHEIADVLRTMGLDPLGRSWPVLFVAFDEDNPDPDAPPRRAWGCEFREPRDSDRVYVVDRRN